MKSYLHHSIIPINKNGGYYENFKICPDRSLYCIHDSKPRQFPGMAAAMSEQPFNSGFMDSSQITFVGDIKFGNFAGILKF